MAASFSCSLKRCLAFRNSHSGLAGVLRSVFPFFLSDSSDKVDMTVCYYSSPCPLEQPGPSYCQRLNMGILSPPVLSLCHHFICVQPAFGIWYLYQSGISDLREKQIWPFTQQVGFSDERSPVISLRSSKNLEKTAYLGGRGGFKQTSGGSLICCFCAIPN